jgi:hypothetical protein
MQLPTPAIEGILGYGFFAGCLLTLDYAGKEVRVGPGRLKPFAILCDMEATMADLKSPFASGS